MSERLDQLRKEVMPWGPYKDQCFEMIPFRYFWKLLEKPWLRPLLRDKVEAFLKESEKENRARLEAERRLPKFPPGSRRHF